MLDTIFFVCTSQRQNHYTSPPPHVRESSHLMPPIPPPLNYAPSPQPDPRGITPSVPQKGVGGCVTRATLPHPHLPSSSLTGTTDRQTTPRGEYRLLAAKISFAVCAREGRGERKRKYRLLFAREKERDYRLQELGERELRKAGGEPFGGGGADDGGRRRFHHVE